MTNSRRPAVPRIWRSEAGIAIVEVMMTSVIVSIAVLGITMMFVKGNAWVAAGGDNRVAMKLAQQKIEVLRAMSFGCVIVGGPEASNAPATVKASMPAPCAADQKYNEGPNQGWVGSTATAAGAAVSAPAPAPSDAANGRFYTRRTCVQHVLETDVTAPAFSGNVGTCLPYVDTTSGNSCAAVGGTCAATNIKRIVVVVTPVNQAGTLERDYTEPPVELRAWISAIPGGI